jgi:hypothetical protein
MSTNRLLQDAQFVQKKDELLMADGGKELEEREIETEKPG